MELALAALITGIGAITVALIQQTKNSNTKEHNIVISILRESINITTDIKNNLTALNDRMTEHHNDNDAHGLEAVRSMIKILVHKIDAKLGEQ